ncbi:Uncharacterised protein [uncultured archaeon]|nr:Uncharacterised protein [uncultured archaeon]
MMYDSERRAAVRLGKSVNHWTKEEDTRLLEFLQQRKTVGEISKLLNRSEYTIQQRASGTHKTTVGVYQRAGEFFEFTCGCSGILKKEQTKLAIYFTQPPRGQGLKIRIATGDRWRCRVAQIISSTIHNMKQCREGGLPIICDDHQVIRKLMENPVCAAPKCGKPLEWIFGEGTTPHLDHDHETGRPMGFTHPGCNRNKRDVGEHAAVQMLIELGYLVIRREDVNGILIR